jgi:methenyltetrahydromethanopterin cyclohydrolase
MLSVNERAYSIVEDLMEFEEDYCVKVHELKNGATVIDCGVEAKGSYDAGMFFVQISMGGLAGINIQLENVKDVAIPFVYVYTDYPALACLGCQMAGWKIEVDGFEGFASGPARALALKPKKIFDMLDYEDDAEYAVLTLESDSLPNEDVAEHVAYECDVDTSEVYMLVAKPDSLVGAIQIVGRVVEVALFKLNNLGYDVRMIKNAMGKCPIPPICEKTSLIANDFIAYYGSVHIIADTYNDLFESATFDKTAYYGKSFEELGEFYSIDPSAFAPAQIVVNAGNRSKVFGKLNPDFILKYFT